MQALPAAGRGESSARMAAEFGYDEAHMRHVLTAAGYGPVVEAMEAKGREA